jgi:hypothetical protein
VSNTSSSEPLVAFDLGWRIIFTIYFYVFINFCFRENGRSLERKRKSQLQLQQKQKPHQIMWRKRQMSQNKHLREKKFQTKIDQKTSHEEGGDLTTDMIVDHHV